MAMTITEGNFKQEVLEADKPVLIDFYADWCGPCKMLSPLIEQIAREMPEAKVCKINVDDEGELAQQFGIMSIPTLVVMKDGQVVNQAVGMRQKQDIKKMLAV